MADLSKLSDDDLRALNAKDYSKISDEGLRTLKSDTPASEPPEAAKPDAWEVSRLPQRERAVYGMGQGIAGMGVGLAQRMLPETVQQTRPFQAIRNWATGPTGGNIAQAGGRIVGPAFVAGPIARAIGAVTPSAISNLIAQLPGWARGAGAGATLAGTTTPTESTSPGEAWRQSAVPAALGAVTGGLAGQAVDNVQAQKAATAAYEASRAAWGRTNAANEAAYNAAMREHPAAMRDWAQKEQQKGLVYQRKLRDYNAASQAYPGSLAEYQRQHAAFAVHQAYNPTAANVEAYRWAMQPIGGTAPMTPGPEGLLKMREDIGAKLNETAGQMSFYPEQDTINALRNPDFSDSLKGQAGLKREFRRIVAGPLQLTQLEDGTFELGRGMSGKQYGDYVSSIRQAADRYAQSARGPMGTDPDKMLMSKRLHEVLDTIENAADAPPGVKEARAQAREAYKRWATIDAAAPVGKGDIADPQRILKAMDRRMKRGEYVTDPMRRQVEAWRVQQGAKPPPKPGERPVPPDEPVRPTRTKPPAEPKRPGPAPNEPQPPAESARAKWPGRAGQLAGHLAGFELGRRLGHPFYGAGIGGAVGRGVGDIAGGAGRGLGGLIGQFPSAAQAGMAIGQPAGQIGAPLAPTLDDLVAAMMQR